MEAQDTIMDDRELALLKEQYVKETSITRPDIREYVYAVRDKQAEITWKARQPEVDEAYKAGMKEVVEWMIAHKRGFYAKPDGTIISVISAEWTEEEWKALAKKVGI